VDPVLLGELAAMLTAVGWGLSSLINGNVAVRVGPISATLARVPFQLVFLGLICLLGGAAVTFAPSPMLAIFLSAVTGLAIGDLLFYKSFIYIGSRAAILLNSLGVCFTAIFGAVFLHEILSFQAFAGVLLAIGGVGMVVTSRSGTNAAPGKEPPTRKEIRTGIVIGLIAASGHAAGYLFLRVGMQENVDPFWGALLRVFMGGSVLWLIGIPKQWPQKAVSGVVKYPVVIKLLLFSCALSAAAACCSCFAMKNVEAGVAATLMGLQPLWVILAVAIMEKHFPPFLMIAGTLVAFAGSALVCLR
jgi:drug/metabolite transporter (DMT)-like permease